MLFRSLPGADLARQLTPEQVIAFGLIHSTGGASLAYQSPAVQRATNAAVQGALRRLGF